MTPISDFTPLAELAEIPQRQRHTPPEVDRILDAAEQIRAGVEARAYAQGTRSNFGITSALSALYTISQWLATFPPAQRDAALKMIGTEAKP
jgi:hypothetical protein